MKNWNILRQVWTIIVGVWCIIVINMVAASQISIFRHTLFVRQSLLSVNDIIQNYFTRKIVMSTALLVLGIACYLVYLLAVEENSFLYVVRILFLSAGIISSAWEISTMFYLDSFTRLAWIKSNDIFWMMFLAVSYSLIFKDGNWKGLKVCNAFIVILFSGICLIQTPTQAAGTVTAYILLAGVLMVVSSVLDVIKNRKRHLLRLLFYNGSMLILNIIFVNVRNGTNTQEHEWNMKAFAYLLAIYAILIFLLKFMEYRNRIFFDKTVNRKINELNRYQNEIIDSTMEIVQKPLDTIYGLDSLLLEKEAQSMNNEQVEILQLIRNEVKRLRKSIIYFKDNTLLQRTGWNMDKMQINFRIIIENVLDSLENEEDGFKEAIHMWITEEDAFIYGDPYYFMQAQLNIMQMLREVHSDGPVEIEIKSSDDNLEVSMRETIRKDAYPRVRKVCAMFNSTRIRNSIGHEDDVSLLLARNLLLAQGGRIRSDVKNGTTLFIKYGVPIWKKEVEKQEEEKEIGRIEMERQDDQIIILISTLQEQINLIKVYLMREPYKLVVFYTGNEALEYIEKTPNVAMVFIGTTFVKMTSWQICSGIRKNYSFGQMPIVLIRRKGFTNVSENVRHNVNDILEEPFSRNDFLMKISSLVFLKKSVEDALRSRLEFLQSQMDPHFIFNTISTIMPLCLSDSEKAYNLLADFSQYLRGNLFADNLYNEVSIRREIELIYSYLTIEEARFGEKIEYTINCDCSEDVKILPLMIEPLVENSVKHGRNGDKILKIMVDIIYSENWIYIQVEDNGKGISEERMREINDMSDEKSIGLANLNKRLKMWYNETLTIHSTEEEGTIVSFRIPAQQREHHENTQL